MAGPPSHLEPSKALKSQPGIYVFSKGQTQGGLLVALHIQGGWVGPATWNTVSFLPSGSRWVFKEKFEFIKKQNRNLDDKNMLQNTSI